MSRPYGRRNGVGVVRDREAKVCLSANELQLLRTEADRRSRDAGHRVSIADILRDAVAHIICADF